MKFADYKCTNPKCKKIIEISIKDTEFFPKNKRCKFCDSICKRIFSPMYTICHQGKCGNSKNGYKSNLGYVKKT